MCTGRLCFVICVLFKNVGKSRFKKSIQAASRAQWVRESCEDWHLFDLSLLLWNMNGDKWAHNHWFPITQTQKTDIYVLKSILVIIMANHPLHSVPYSWPHQPQAKTRVHHTLWSVVVRFWLLSSETYCFISKTLILDWTCLNMFDNFSG